MQKNNVIVKILLIILSCALACCFAFGCKTKSDGDGKETNGTETVLPGGDENGDTDKTPSDGSEDTGNGNGNASGGEDNENSGGGTQTPPEDSGGNGNEDTGNGGTQTPPENSGEDNENGGGSDTAPSNKWDVSAEPVTAELVKNGEKYKLVVTGSGDMKSWDKKQDAPWHGFSDKINEIKIGGSVTGIGANSFADVEADKIIIPQSVKTVGKNALPKNAEVYAYANTQIDGEQNDGIEVYIYSEGVPQTYDRHWTSWGSSADITAAPFEDEVNYWYSGNGGAPEKWNKKKVLFIGNSFTFYYQIPAQFSAIAHDLGIYVETYSIAVPSRTLSEHASSTNQIDLLFNKVKDFDYIVLQEQSTRPYTDYAKFIEGITALKTKIESTQPKAEIYLYETWGSPASAGGNSADLIAEMEEKLYLSYSQVATDLNLNVTYVGRAFTTVKQETDINLYFGDNRHPGPAGSYLSACVHVASMLGGDVRKTTLSGKDMVVISNEGGQPQPMNLSEQDCEILRSAAYDTVYSESVKTTYTVKFWHGDTLKESITVKEGLGFTLPDLQIEGVEKFSGWKAENGQTVYSAGQRLTYSSVSQNIADGELNFYAQTHELIIAVWGRFITEDNFKKVMEGFEAYCGENGLDFEKATFIYYIGKVQNVDPYFLIADYTKKALADGADIIFPCGNNITNAAQSAVAGEVKETKPLGVGVEGDTTRYVARLSDGALSTAFYEYITTDAAKAILSSL